MEPSLWTLATRRQLFQCKRCGRAYEPPVHTHQSETTVAEFNWPTCCGELVLQPFEYNKNS